MTTTTYYPPPNNPQTLNVRPPWWRRRTFIAAVALVAVVAIGAGVIALAPPSLDRPAVGSVWERAGVVSMTITNGPDVVLTADTRRDMSTPRAENEVVLRFAKVVWRTVPGRVYSARVKVHPVGVPDHVSDSTYSQTDMLLQFGPRPADLDRFAVQLPRPDVTAKPAPPTAYDRDAITEWWAQTARRTSGYLGRDTAFPVDHALIATCGLGAGTQMPVRPQEIGVNGTAEATLPGVGDFWTAIGLAVDTGELDAGGSVITASIPARADLGVISVMAISDFTEPQTVRILVEAGCDNRPPRPTQHN